MSRSISAAVSAFAVSGVLALAAPAAHAAAGSAATHPANGPHNPAVLSIQDFHRQAHAARAAGNVQAAYCASVYIYSTANGRYVSAELGYTGGDYGMLRARATSVGSWETYTDCYDGTYDTFNAANGRYVSAELGYTGGDYGMLRARATTVGPWEKFVLLFASDGSYVIVGANSRYVSAELGYTGGDYGMLRARATAIGPWEIFF